MDPSSAHFSDAPDRDLPDGSLTGALPLSLIPSEFSHLQLVFKSKNTSAIQTLLPKRNTLRQQLVTEQRSFASLSWIAVSFLQLSVQVSPHHRSQCKPCRRDEFVGTLAECESQRQRVVV